MSQCIHGEKMCPEEKAILKLNLNVIFNIAILIVIVILNPYMTYLVAIVFNHRILLRHLSRHHLESYQYQLPHGHPLHLLRMDFLKTHTHPQH